MTLLGPPPPALFVGPHLTDLYEVCHEEPKLDVLFFGKFNATISEGATVINKKKKELKKMPFQRKHLLNHN